MEEEIWKPIKDFPDYEVSNLGRVCSYKYKEPHILKPALHKGYCFLRLSQNNEGKVLYIHRLVAETFIPNPFGLPIADHINRQPADNRVTNLRWVTHSGNMLNIDRTNKNIKILSGNRYRVRFHKEKKEYCRIFKTLEEALSYRDSVLGQG